MRNLSYISPKAAVRASPVHGRGLFALKRIGKGEIVAMRDIDPGEELTHDWATTDDDTYEMECNCGAPSCRRVITGKDWRQKDLQTRYWNYMSWYLQRKIIEEFGDPTAS